MPTPLSLTLSITNDSGAIGPSDAPAGSAARDRGRFDPQRSAGRHGVPRVDGEVHQDLFELSAVRHRADLRTVEPRLDRDVFADDPAQHRLHFRHDVVEVHRLRLQQLPAAEREQLARERGRALARLQHLLDGRPVRIGVAHAFEQQLSVPRDHGEQIVEVVGDAPGELADRLHLL